MICHPPPPAPPRVTNCQELSSIYQKPKLEQKNTYGSHNFSFAFFFASPVASSAKHCVLLCLFPPSPFGSCCAATQPKREPKRRTIKKEVITQKNTANPWATWVCAVFADESRHTCPHPSIPQANIKRLSPLPPPPTPTPSHAPSLRLLAKHGTPPLSFGVDR